MDMPEIERLQRIFALHDEMEPHVLAVATGFSLAFSNQILCELVRMGALTELIGVTHTHFLCGVRVFVIPDKAASMPDFPLTCPSCEEVITGDGDYYCSPIYVKRSREGGKGA